VNTALRTIIVLCGRSKFAAAHASTCKRQPNQRGRSALRPKTRQTHTFRLDALLTSITFACAPSRRASALLSNHRKIMSSCALGAEVWFLIPRETKRIFPFRSPQSRLVRHPLDAKTYVTVKFFGIRIGLHHTQIRYMTRDGPSTIFRARHHDVCPSRPRSPEWLINQTSLTNVMRWSVFKVTKELHRYRLVPISGCAAPPGKRTWVICNRHRVVFKIWRNDRFEPVPRKATLDVAALQPVAKTSLHRHGGQS